MTTKNIGDEGFFWFIGIVENRDDPEKLGRLQIRIYNHHTDNKALMPTNELPWASVLMPVNSASSNKIGISPTGIIVGSTVVGFFMDGADRNRPIIMGTIYGKPGNNPQNHDVPEQAREINNIQKNYENMEPQSAYAAKYPYNKVIKTERGHVIELDDTPGQERIHLYHKSGTYTEINKDGRKVDKVVDDYFEIVVKNNNLHVLGNVNINVDGNYTLISKGKILFKAPDIEFIEG